jgi:hypothetical protein
MLTVFLIVGGFVVLVVWDLRGEINLKLMLTGQREKPRLSLVRAELTTNKKQTSCKLPCPLPAGTLPGLSKSAKHSPSSRPAARPSLCGEATGPCFALFTRSLGTVWVASLSRFLPARA